jgi:prepilin-type N-terminal cleavage/methylation domain-containing protein
MSATNCGRCAAPPIAHALCRRSERGFSLIEIALVLVVMGVLLGMSLKSQDLLEQYRQSQFVTQVQTLVSNARAHRSAVGRWPGDCNRDGLVDGVFVTLGTLTSGARLDYAVSTSLASAATSDAAYTLGNVCPLNSLRPFENVNVAFNELKRAALTPTGESNRKSANHGLGGFAYLGTFETASSGVTIEQKFNAVLLTDVSIQVARRLATAIDGQDGSAANTGRVRRTNDDLQTFAPLWTAAGETELARTTVVVFFDRIPP